MPQVFNKRHGNAPPGAVYIGRGSKWGNPYRIGVDGDRDEVIRKYLYYLIRSGLILDVRELAGKDLVCWCAPLACHGYVLLHLANSVLYD